MDYLIINKLLANKKGKISNRTKRTQGKKTQKNTDSILIKEKHLDESFPNITHEGDHPAQTKGPVSPFPLTKMPSSPTKSSHITSPTSPSPTPQPKSTTSSYPTPTTSTSTKISPESVNKSSTTTASSSSLSSSSISPKSNHTGTVSSSDTKTTAIGKIKSSPTSNLPEITTNTGKTKKNRFKGDDQSYYTDYSDFTETDPKDMMFFDSE